MSSTLSPAPRIVRLRDGTPVLLRRQRRGDRALLERLFAGLSGRSRYLRFMAGMPPALPPRILEALSAVDDHAHVGVLALRADHIVGAARYVRSKARPYEADVAFTVSDAFQRRGLGRLMMDELLDQAASAGIERLTFDILADNHGAAALVRSLGATIRYSGGEGVATLLLAQPVERLAA